MDESASLWQRALEVMPGGVSLLSKHPDKHAPGVWPTYFDEARGCRVRTLDGAEYVDMGLMGIGTSTLGYAFAPVDEAVHSAVRRGVSSTLNCPEEVWLAERLVQLHDWAKGVRFARSGGEANAIAVRIARAATGRDTVAVCGYHGWHDWYLAANLRDPSRLDGHLMHGLEPRGVPDVLMGTAVPFHFNDLEAVKSLFARERLAAVVMEVERSTTPDPGFLESIRRLANDHGTVLIFDECTSGFRTTLGGHHLKLGVTPDLAVFGKALGNGYAIAAVLGSESVMFGAQGSFISSTFWSERIGPTAALATLDAMQHLDAPARIDGIGRRYRELLVDALGPLSDEVVFSGLPALTTIAVPALESRIGWQQHLSALLLASGYLGGAKLYASLAQEDDLEPFVDVMAQSISRLLGSMDGDRITGGNPLGAPPADFYRLA